MQDYDSMEKYGTEKSECTVPPFSVEKNISIHLLVLVWLAFSKPEYFYVHKIIFVSNYYSAI
jgi:hypothetical protein